MPDPPILRLMLRDGRPVALRPVVPEDRDRLLAGFDELSAESRRLRFLGSVSHLSESQLDYLTDVDGVNHVAWGVLDLSDPDAPGFGIGRFVRLEDSSDTAEFSLTVLDTAQGLGVGQLLLAVLVVAAEHVDIRVLRGVVGRENNRMSTWLRRLGASSKGDGQDLIMDLVLPVDPEASPSAGDFVDAIERVRAKWPDSSPSRPNTS